MIRIVDIICEDRGIKGEISFDENQFDEIEMMEIAHMVMRVIEKYCYTRDYVHENLDDYEVTIN